MNPLDDLFRDGLGSRKADVPGDMWQRIQQHQPPLPAGEVLDRHFANALRDRKAPVPPGMWARIVAARTAPARTKYYVAAAAMILLLLLGVAYQSWPAGALPTTTDVPAEISTEPVAPSVPQAGLNLNEAATGTEVTAIAATDPDEATTAGLAQTTSSTTRSVATPILPMANLGTAVTTTDQREPGAANTATVNAQAQTGEVISEVVPPTNVTPTIDAASTDQAVAQLATSNWPLATQEVQSLEKDPTPKLNFTQRGYRPTATPGGSFSRAPRHRMQTEMLFGAAYANQLLTVQDESSRNLLAARENSEYPEVSYQVTLRQAYRLTDQVVLRGGLTYVDIRNQFDYEEIINGVTELTRRNNHIRMLEVPVLAGLQIPGKRLRVSLNAGPVFNLTTSVQGTYLDPDSPEPLRLEETGEFRSYTGVGYMSSLTTTYAIGKRDPFVLVLEPFFKHYPSSFTTEGARLRESYWLAGLQLGVRKSL